MPRFYLRLLLLPLLIFTAVLLLIRAQPYDDHNLRQLLLSDGCPAPCFMGIRPGVTTVKEAITRLEASGWVTDLQVTKAESITDGESYISVRWNWNTHSSSVIETAFPAYIFSYEQDIRSAVDEIRVPMKLKSGHIQLLLQVPTMYALIEGMPDAFGKLPMAITIYYDRVESSSYLECPVNMRDVWVQRSNLTFYSSAQSEFGYTKKWDSRQLIRTLKSNCG